MTVRCFPIVALASCALLLGAPARAQNLLQRSVMTHIDAAPTGAIAAAPPPAAASAPPAAVEAGSVLRRLPNNAQGLRLPGEIASSEWPVYLTEAQSKQHLRFQLGYLSAIANLPSASSLVVQINDVVVGEIKVDAPYKVKVITFDIPDDLVKPGFNSLRLVAEHRHRADCSLTATYELWTQIDATQTGFLIPARVEAVNSLADLPGLPPGEHGAMPIHAVLPAATSTAAIDRMIRVAEQVAIQGRFEQPLVDVGETSAGGDGVNLVVGPFDQIRGDPALSGLPAPAGPLAQLLPASKTRRATILVTGRTVEEVDEAIRLFAEGHDSIGTRQGLRAALAFPGYHLEGGAHLRLRDLGLISQEFSGRLFRSTFNIVMPPDFYPADYAKVQINLAGAYAPGLSPGAQIVVSVNDKIAVGSPLGKSSGEIFKARAITVPLGALHPGLNRISLEAQLPAPQDAACVPGQDQKRFLFLDETEIILPSIARVAMSPNLSITANGGFPYAAWRGVSHLYVPKPDVETIGAAATLISRMALSAGRSMNLQLSLTPPLVSDGSTLAVGPAGAFTPAMLAVAGLDPVAMGAIWQHPPQASDDGDQRAARSKYEAANAARVALQRNFPAECRLRVPRAKSRLQPAKAAAPAAAVVPSSFALLQQAASAKPEELGPQWEKAVNGGGWWAWWTKFQLPSLDHPVLAAVYDWAAQFVAAGRQRIETHIAARPSPISEDATLLVAQRNNGQSGEGIWTIVTGATPAALREGVSCLVDPRVWSQLGGEIAALNSSEAKIARLDALNPSFITTQALSYSNLRLIAAGWFSINIWAYVAIVLLMALVLAVVTFVSVRHVGRRT